MSAQPQDWGKFARIGIMIAIVFFGALFGARFVNARKAAAAQRVAFANKAAPSSAPARSFAKTKPVSPVSADPSTLPDAETIRSAEQPGSDVAGTFTPSKRGAGAVLDFNPKNAPLVPKGMSVDKYIASYYEDILAGRWDAASKLVPKTDPRGSVKDFKTLQYGYEVKSFNVLSSVAGPNGNAAVVVHITPNNGVWDVTWEFVKTARGLVLKDLTYARPGDGVGCH